jgi:hypothetical protein
MRTPLHSDLHFPEKIKASTKEQARKTKEETIRTFVKLRVLCGFVADVPTGFNSWGGGDVFVARRNDRN